MPELVHRVIPTEEDSPRLPRVDAQAVVINLGTNDFFQATPKTREFIDTYLRLIGAVRERWPAALIVLVVGPMLADDHPQPRALSQLRAWVKTVIARRRAAGDAALELMEVWTDPAEGVGCDFHPNLQTHARLGQELAARLSERLDW
jgi:lysophospholipase L1-like esterase